jgi:hypothetical protein
MAKPSDIDLAVIELVRLAKMRCGRPQVLLGAEDRTVIGRDLSLARNVEDVSGILPRSPQPMRQVVDVVRPRAARDLEARACKRATQIRDELLGAICVIAEGETLRPKLNHAKTPARRAQKPFPCMARLGERSVPRMRTGHRYASTAGKRRTCGCLPRRRSLTWQA